jgi:hypothetical protein
VKQEVLGLLVTLVQQDQLVQLENKEVQVKQDPLVKQVMSALQDPQALKEILDPLGLQEILDLVVKLAQQD